MNQKEDLRIPAVIDHD